MIETFIVLLAFFATAALAVTVFYALVIIPFHLEKALREISARQADANRLLSAQNEAIQRISEQLDWRNVNR